MEMADEAAEEGGEETAGFECNICFGLAKDPVITLCGHLHCWACLYEWLRFHSQSHECPVCKAFIRDEQLISLHGRTANTNTAFHHIPRRPPAAAPHGRRRSGFIPAAAATGQFGLTAVRRVRFREFSGYGSFGEGVGNGEVEDGNNIIDDNNIKKILFFILVFLVFDFLII